MELTDTVIEVERVPGRCGGAPTLKGTRIGIHNIVSYARVYGGDLQKVSEEALPDLSVAQIEAALAWYEANREEVDEILRGHREGYLRLLTQGDGAG
jgi:uncharacterized protein (DUF433 family)